jgi:hypothetical protein
MTNSTSGPAREDVLEAFAIEPSTSRETLESYLRRYPQFADALIDLSRELHRELPQDTGPENAEDQARIDAAWRRHREAGSSQAHSDPFAALSADQLRALAQTLDVPRQVITAIRDGRVILASVPRRFLAQLAAGLNRSLDALLAALPPAPAVLATARTYKSDVKPSASEPVTFERVLIDAGVPADKRTRLLAEAD